MVFTAETTILPVTGNIDFERVSYQGAKEGKYLILQKGDESVEPKTYQPDQLQSAIQQILFLAFFMKKP